MDLFSFHIGNIHNMKEPSHLCGHYPEGGAAADATFFSFLFFSFWQNSHQKDRAGREGEALHVHA